MRLQSYLTNEEYYKRIKGYKKSYEVFINPSKKELKSIGDDVRFIADNRVQRLYVWDWKGKLHDDFWRDEQSSNLQRDIGFGLAVGGVASFHGGKWIMNEGDGNGHTNGYVRELKVRKVDNYLKKIEWIDTYISVTPWVKDIRENEW